jgi:hypothetical protein
LEPLFWQVDAQHPRLREDLADPVTVELVTSTQHKVSLKKVMKWMAHAGGTSPKEIAMKARVPEGCAGLGPISGKGLSYPVAVQ